MQPEGRSTKTREGENKERGPSFFGKSKGRLSPQPQQTASRVVEECMGVATKRASSVQSRASGGNINVNIKNTVQSTTAHNCAKWVIEVVPRVLAVIPSGQATKNSNDCIRNTVHGT
eukprot:scaffold75201_cov24-Tisochrysis_lutea.AAC.2